METTKDKLNFCNAAIIYGYRDESVSEDLNQVRKFIINSSYKTIPNTTLLTSLSIIDDIISMIMVSKILLIIFMI